MFRLLDFDKQLISRCFIDTTFFDLFQGCYCLFTGKIVRDSIQQKERSMMEEEALELHRDIYECIPVKFPQSYPALHAAIIEESEEAICRKYGKSSVERENLRNVLPSATRILDEIEKLLPDERAAIRVSMIHAVSHQLGTLYQSCAEIAFQAEAKLREHIFSSEHAFDQILFVQIWQDKQKCFFDNEAAPHLSLADRLKNKN